MAESQLPFPYTPADIAAVRTALSTPRFATYLARAGGDDLYAIALYLYNGRLAKAFLYPLNLAEVTLRNAIDESLVGVYGLDWPFDANFRDHFLVAEGRATLDKAIDRVGPHATKDKVVAALTFDFWSNLFRVEYGAFWRTKLNVVLPHIPRGVSRHDVQLMVKAINAFRNRIAHHEPIFDLDANGVLAKIRLLVSYRCPTVAGWMRHHTTVAPTLRTRPGAKGGFGVALADRFDPAIIRVSGNETLTAIIAALNGASRVVVRIDAAGAPTGACAVDDIIASIGAAAAGVGGLVSIDDLQIDTVLGAPGAAPHWAPLADDAPMTKAIEILQRPQIRILVGVAAASGAASGAILRAHRRY